MGLACPRERNRDRAERSGRHCMQLFDFLHNGADHYSGSQRRGSVSDARMSPDIRSWHIRGRRFPCRQVIDRCRESGISLASDDTDRRPEWHLRERHFRLG